MLFRVKPKPDAVPAEIGGIRVKPSPRARRLSLRVEARSGEVVLTWPLRRGPSEKKALRFIDENRDWIARQRKRILPAKSFAPGMQLAVLGRDYTIEHRAGRGITRFEGERIVVHGAPEHTARRLRDFLKKQALEILSARTREKTDVLGLKPSPVRIVDPKTRWGSCGPDGRIMYSWRVILAPPEVADYLVAHEVAHRVHMNHSRKFWALCLSLCDNGVSARRWLKKHGQELMSYA